MNMLLITLIVVYVVDLSGWTGSWKPAAQRLLRRLGIEADRLRPFDCSRCMTFWACLAWAVVTGHLTLPHIAAVCALSYFADTIGDLMRAAKEGVDRILTKLLKFVIMLHFTDEQYAYLAQFEGHFHRAIENQYYWPIGIENARRINDIYADVTGNRRKDVTCGSCRRELLAAIGRLWREDKAAREAAKAEPAAEPAPKKKTTKKSKKK